MLLVRMPWRNSKMTKNDSSSTSNELLVRGVRNDTVQIPHEKMKTLDNLISIINDNKPDIKLPDNKYKRGWLTTTAVLYSVGALALTGTFVVSNPVFMGMSAVLMLGGAMLNPEEDHKYSVKTNFWNVIPRLLFSKDFNKKKKDFLKLEETSLRQQKIYSDALEVVQSKIEVILEDLNKELNLGTGYLKYNAEKMELELASANEYKSPVLRQIVQSSDLSSNTVKS